MAGVMTGGAVGTERGLLVNVFDENWDRILPFNITGMKNCLLAELRHIICTAAQSSG